MEMGSLLLMENHQNNLVCLVFTLLHFAIYIVPLAQFYLARSIRNVDGIRFYCGGICGLLVRIPVVNFIIELIYYFSLRLDCKSKNEKRNNIIVPEIG